MFFNPGHHDGKLLILLACAFVSKSSKRKTTIYTILFFFCRHNYLVWLRQCIYAYRLCEINNGNITNGEKS